MIRIVPYESRYRDDMLYCFLAAREAVSGVPSLREDLLDIPSRYLDRGHGFWLALDERNRVCGMCGLKIVSETDAWLKRLFVRPSEKRYGIERLFIAQAEAFAVERGITQLHTRYCGSYREAAAFYPAMGFAKAAPTEEVRHLVKHIQLKETINTIPGGITMKIETQALHAGYEPQNGEPRALPIYQSTTYRYDSTDHVGQLFDLTADGHMYSRISNPTVAAVEAKIAAMEGGVGALCTTSGQAASLISLLNILKCGDHFLAASTIYGGTINLFNVTFKRFGIEVTFIDPDSSVEEIQAAIRPNTRAVFGETLANPAMNVFDIEKFATAAHVNGLPLIVDNTFATPVLCRPFEWGADIVIHSTTKYMEGHATYVGGVIVDAGRFNWANGKFPEFTEPDDSYHGVIYTKNFGNAAYITKARVQMMRDLGCYPSATAAFALNLGLETLAVRMERCCRNAEEAARFLNKHGKVEAVAYPNLSGDKYHSLAKKYLPNGCSGVIAFTLKGGREAAVRFIDSLKLASLEVHVADIRTCVLNPASSTHRQLTDEQLAAAGISPGLIRLSLGLENIEDILDDLRQALENA